MFINQTISKFLIFFFCFSIFSSIAQTNEDVPLNNIAINQTPKPILPIIFEDFLGNEINLKNYYGKLIIINFWATWCAPCREEMPSLDKLQIDEELENLKIFPINVGQEKISKSEDFYKDYKIKNLDIYHDQSLNLPNKFLLRGLPTTIFIDKNGLEFARAVGSIDFQNEKFINWLKKYD